MTKTTIIKDERGRIEIVAYLKPASYTDSIFGVGVYFTPPGKRKQIYVTNDFNLVTKEEIHEAKLALWEDLKPKL